MHTCGSPTPRDSKRCTLFRLHTGHTIPHKHSHTSDCRPHHTLHALQQTRRIKLIRKDHHLCSPDTSTGALTSSSISPSVYNNWLLILCWLTFVWSSWWTAQVPPKITPSLMPSIQLSVSFVQAVSLTALMCLLDPLPALPTWEETETLSLGLLCTERSEEPDANKLYILYEYAEWGKKTLYISLSSTREKNSKKLVKPGDRKSQIRCEVSFL